MSSIKRKAAAQIAGSDAKKPKQNASITSFFGAPKAISTSAANGVKSSPGGSFPASTAASEVAAKFDKAKWVATLTDEQRELLQLEIDTLDESWLAQLKGEIVTKEFLDLKRFLGREATAGKKVFPPPEDIYSWYGLTRITHFPSRPLLITTQVPSYSIPQYQGCRHRPGPLPQSQPGSWSSIFRQATHFCPAVAEEHLHLPEERLPVLRPAS